MRLIILLGFIFFCSFLFGTNQNYKSTQLTIYDGLAHNTVECIFKDSEGFMWFGTHNGLNRYDGTSIKTYQNTPSDSFSISGNRILCINEDEQGYLWIGTMANGLNRFDKKTERFHHYKSTQEQNSLPYNTVHNIKILDNNSLWICTGNGLSLYDYEKDNFRSYFTDYNKEVSARFIVYDICKASSNDIYVATNHNYIYKLHSYSGKFEPVSYTRDPLLGGNYRKHIAEGPDGNIWISAFSHGLIKLDPKSGKSKLFDTTNSDLPSDLLNGDFVVAQDKLWLTTDGDGIITYSFKNGEFEHFQHDPNIANGLFSNKIYNIFIDEQDIIWAATFDEGVNILDPNPLKFSILKTNQGYDFSLKGNSVLAILEDSKGRIWLGTDGSGLYRYNKDGTVKRYLHDPNNSNSLSTDRIVCMNEDLDGNILLGTFNGGFIVFDAENEKFTNYKEGSGKDELASKHVWNILVESESKIWLGLLGNGLNLFNPLTKTFTHYGPNSDNHNRINHDNVMAIIKDKAGDLWFGTEGQGVNILDKQSNQMLYSIHPESESILSTINLKCLYEDSKGFIWIGTVNGGLNRYNKVDKAMAYYTMEDGLPSGIIYSIVEDDNNNLWIGTAYGISKYDSKTKHFTNYDVNDGLLGYVFNRNAICKLKNGNILVGSTNGLNVFNPAAISDINYVPKPIFTGLRIQNKVVNIGDSINGRVVLNQSLNQSNELLITPADNVFTLDFAAQTYTLPNACKFEYRLEGFDKNWNRTDASRQHVTYTNLDPGHYVFKLKAANSDEVWNTEERTLSITVLPTFWGTIWFKLIVAFIILLFLYAWYRYKLKIKEEQFLGEKKEQEQKIIHLEKEKLEGELNNQTFNILNRNRTLINHKRRLSQLMNRVDEKNKTTLYEIIKEIDAEVNEEKDWKHIEPRLDKVYNNFMTTLKGKHDKLTQNELRIAAYVRMGLSTKEISELMQKTTKAVDNERYRLRKKLDIPQNDSLKKYLLDL